GRTGAPPTAHGQPHHAESRHPPPGEGDQPDHGGDDRTNSGCTEQGNEHPPGVTLHAATTGSSAVNPVHVLVVAVHSPALTIRSRNTSSGTSVGCHTLFWSSQRTGYGSYCTHPSGVWSQNRCMSGSCSCIRSL